MVLCTTKKNTDYKNRFAKEVYIKINGGKAGARRNVLRKQGKSAALVWPAGGLPSPGPPDTGLWGFPPPRAAWIVPAQTVRADPLFDGFNRAFKL